MPTLSACILARDVARVLPACLQSLEGAVDEIVVVDTGSRDETPSVARASGARVVRIRWPEDEGAARNAAAEACTGDAVFFVEPWERLAPGGAEGLRAAVEEGLPAALVHQVEADSPTADPAMVVAGTGRLSEPRLTPRLLGKDGAARWEGIALARPRVSLVEAPALGVWLVSVGAVTGASGADPAETWRRRAAAAPEEARVVAVAADRKSVV